MRVSMVRRSLIEQISELVGLKSGLGMSGAQVVEILENSFDRIHETGAMFLYAPTKWWGGDLSEGVSVRAEEIEADFMLVMHGIGATTDSLVPGVLVQRQWKNLNYSKGDKIPVSEVMRASHEVSAVVMSLFKGQCPAGYEAIHDEYQKRHIMNRSLPDNREWNGIIELNDLFQSEAVPKSTTKDQYFDRRYVDFLLAQGEQLKKIHWRQFEYLTGQYFKHLGYEVTITPPRGDGGVDVIAKKTGEMLGPELVIAQCKRHSETNTVSIETVKAFYTDVNDRKATRGVVVTTSAFETGAKNFCEAHNFRLTAVDGARVADWLKALAGQK